MAILAAISAACLAASLFMSFWLMGDYMDGVRRHWRTPLIAALFSVGVGLVAFVNASSQ